MRERPGALLVLADRLFLHHRMRIMDFAAKERLELVVRLDVAPVLRILQAVLADVVPHLFGNLGPRQRARSDHGDRLARGYVTIDAVQACNVKNPGDPGYLDVFAIQSNRLTGEVYYLSGNIARADARSIQTVREYGPPAWRSSKALIPPT